MKRMKIMTGLTLALFGLLAGLSADSEQTYQANWESLKQYTIPDWYRDAKLGIFIHWGVYSVPAFGSEWYPRNMYQQDHEVYQHHIDTYGKQTEFGYKDFIPMFKAENYDPAAWARLFKKSGAKYIVPVAEHHDGFAMYDTDLTRWNAVDMGPKRDLIGDLAEAVRAEDLIFGLSSHRAEHWWFYEGGKTFDSDVQDEAYEDLYGPAYPKQTNPNGEFLDDWLARATELVDKYEPQLIWFDWWIEEPAFVSYIQRFGAYYYNKAEEWEKGVVINYKDEAFPIEAAVYDIERGQLAGIRYPLWQTDTSVAKNSWGYTEGNDYKSVDSLVDDLVDIVSKNGVLLLNIGPRADGTIPQEDQEILLGIGEWLGVNGEAIYGTRPWKIFGEGPTEVIEGTFNDTKREGFSDQDVRFTTKNGSLYAIVMAWPEDQSVTVRALGSKSEHLDKAIDEIGLLGSESNIEWTQSDAGLTVRFPDTKPCENAYALKIDFKD